MRGKKHQLHFVIWSIILLALPLLGCVNTQVYNRGHRITNFATAKEMQYFTDFQPKKVIVLPFSNSVGHGGLGSKVANEFSIQVLKTGRFQVVERQQLQSILNEQKLKFDERFDAATVQKMGKLLGVDGIFLGNITRYDDNTNNPVVGMNVRLVDVATGQTLWAAEDVFYGSDPSVIALVPRSERWKVQSDIDYLTRLLAKELAQTLSI